MVVTVVLQPVFAETVGFFRSEFEEGRGEGFFTKIEGKALTPALSRNSGRGGKNKPAVSSPSGQ